MDILWWSILGMNHLFFFLCTGSLVYSFCQKSSNSTLVKRLLVLPLLIFWYSSPCPQVFFFNFYFWNSFYLLGWLPKILIFSLLFRVSFTLCSTSKNIFSNIIFKLSFIFLLSYFKFLRILLILNCSFHQDVRSWLIGKDSDIGRDQGQEEKGTTEDEMAGWHHWLDGRESEWTLGVGDGQGGLECCDSSGRKELDTTERLNWTEESILLL